jgi:hypothetical protein
LIFFLESEEKRIALWRDGLLFQLVRDFINLCKPFWMNVERRKFFWITLFANVSQLKWIILKEPFEDRKYLGTHFKYKIKINLGKINEFFFLEILSFLWENCFTFRNENFGMWHFECLSPRDYVDTKPWLAYEQNPYSTDWVRSGSFHRETSLHYDISLLSLGYKPTWISDFLTIRQHLDAPISGLCNLTTTSMTRQCRHKHELVALSLAWLSPNIMPQPNRPDSIVASLTR